VLFATTSTILQTLLDTAASYLQSCGLCVNAAKCFTVLLRNVPKEKMLMVDARCTFSCLGRAIPALKRSDEWNYLGVPFIPKGRLMSNLLEQLRKDLNILTAALKPQQRMFALRTIVLPSLYHQLVLGQTNISLLNKLDIAVRTSIRNGLLYHMTYPAHTFMPTPRTENLPFHPYVG